MACDATNGIAVAILSIHLSIRRVYCDKTKWSTAHILIPHKTVITLVFWHQLWLVGDALFPVIYSPKVNHPFEKCHFLHIYTYNVSTVRDSKKSSITTIIKLTMGFPMSYRWSVYITPKSRKGGSKSDFFRFFNKSQLQLNKVCYKVSLCENFHQQSCSNDP